ncbi:GH32 C-terminal domain-containing protein [Paraburkholderia hospita]|jgi:hypothetical protein|uniref:GH32 C-terminal domain-containing protein n=1 Tax=Paraburkholderia hospita TaxID=169430 RepID=UPI002ADD821C|nr:GH32 C-terminal domain-containing protein [Paraburkholderia hospita]
MALHIVNLPLHDGRLHLQVVVDRNSIEVSAHHGRAVITGLIFLAFGDDRVRVFAEGGDATFSDIALTNTNCSFAPTISLVAGHAESRTTVQFCAEK